MEGWTGLELVPFNAVLNMIKINYNDKKEVYKMLLAILSDYNERDVICDGKIVHYIRILLQDHLDLADCLVSFLPVSQNRNTSQLKRPPCETINKNIFEKQNYRTKRLKQRRLKSRRSPWRRDRDNEKKDTDGKYVHKIHKACRYKMTLRPKSTVKLCPSAYGAVKKEITSQEENTEDEQTTNVIKGRLKSSRKSMDDKNGCPTTKEPNLLKGSDQEFSTVKDLSNNVQSQREQSQHNIASLPCKQTGISDDKNNVPKVYSIPFDEVSEQETLNISSQIPYHQSGVHTAMSSMFKSEDEPKYSPFSHIQFWKKRLAPTHLSTLNTSPLCSVKAEEFSSVIPSLNNSPSLCPGTTSYPFISRSIQTAIHRLCPQPYGDPFSNLRCALQSNQYTHLPTVKSSNSLLTKSISSIQSFRQKWFETFCANSSSESIQQATSTTHRPLFASQISKSLPEHSRPIITHSPKFTNPMYPNKAKIFRYSPDIVSQNNSNELHNMQDDVFLPLAPSCLPKNKTTANVFCDVGQDEPIDLSKSRDRHESEVVYSAKTTKESKPSYLESQNNLASFPYSQKMFFPDGKSHNLYFKRSGVDISRPHRDESIIREKESKKSGRNDSALPRATEKFVKTYNLDLDMDKKKGKTESCIPFYINQPDVAFTVSYNGNIQQETYQDIIKTGKPKPKKVIMSSNSEVRRKLRLIE